MLSFIKQSAEGYPISVDFKEKLPQGVSISSGAVSAVDTSDGSNATATVLSSSTATIAGDRATFGVRAGTSGSSYRITLLVTLSSGLPLQEDIIMRVDDL